MKQLYPKYVNEGDVYWDAVVSLRIDNAFGVSARD